MAVAAMAWVPPRTGCHPHLPGASPRRSPRVSPLRWAGCRPCRGKRRRPSRSPPSCAPRPPAGSDPRERTRPRRADRDRRDNHCSISPYSYVRTTEASPGYSSPRSPVRCATCPASGAERVQRFSQPQMNRNTFPATRAGLCRPHYPPCRGRVGGPDQLLLSRARRTFGDLAGLLTTTNRRSSLPRDLTEHGIPHVLVNPVLDAAESPSCAVDNAAGARSVANLVADLRHSVVASIQGPHRRSVWKRCHCPRRIVRGPTTRPARTKRRDRHRIRQHSCRRLAIRQPDHSPHRIRPARDGCRRPTVQRAVGRRLRSSEYLWSWYCKGHMVPTVTLRRQRPSRRSTKLPQRPVHLGVPTPVGECRGRHRRARNVRWQQGSRRERRDGSRVASWLL